MTVVAVHEDRAEDVGLLPGDTRCGHPPSAVDQLRAAELLALLPGSPDWPERKDGPTSAKYLRGAARVLAWLQQFDGDGWQARWDTANGNATQWIDRLVEQDRRTAVSSRDELLAGLRFLMLARAFRPSYEFFHSYRPVRFYDCAQRTLGSDLFAGLDQTGAELGMPRKHVNDAKKTLVKIMLHTGASLDSIDEVDFFELRDHYLDRHRHIPHGTSQAWDLLQATGVLSATRSLQAVVHRQGQRPTSELVDSYRLRCRPVRDVLVRYLDQRRPGMDYASFRGLVTSLVKLFWADIEHHHPGVVSLNLSSDTADAWKERVQIFTAADGTTRPRRHYLATLVRVRAFYLDMQEWALEDASWVPWAVPCPIRRGDTDGMVKLKKNGIATMHQRVRDRLPHLDRIVDAADQHRREAAEILAIATDSKEGDTIEHAGVQYRRVQRYKNERAPRHIGSHAITLQRMDTGARRDIAKEEDDAFWSWAVVETLRHTGVRLEELLEITQLALVQYRLPDTGEVVPLLQIVPSKNAEERLLLVSPELANTLAAVITRVRKQNDGIVPPISRYDPYEKIEGPSLPHLFQRRNNGAWRSTVISLDSVYGLLQLSVDRAGVTDNAGTPLRYTPHDFRRIFTTEAVTGGLPVHIAAKLLGHANLNTTQHYLAVFQEDMVRAYRSFLDNRRRVRPETEYREPTDQEWADFHQHFHERKLELGTCGRPYGSPCQHEHACIRCPMLRVDPKQRSRLIEIVNNLGERIQEARMNGWLGEVQGLQTSRDAAARKLVGLDRTIAQTNQAAGSTNLGIPTITRAPRVTDPVTRR